ncbi:hypothetical protein OAJ15_01305 [Pseudomonadota bacterium]|nr:hypothetical protein [Pseudomonadota bacterium]
MAKELFAGQRKNKYKIVISKEAISRKNIAPLLKMHKKHSSFQMMECLKR